MRKFFKKLFNLDRVEVLQDQVKSLERLCQAADEKRKKEVSTLSLQLDTYRGRLQQYEKTWKGLGKFDDNRVYYVVTQGGYYQIKGWKINKSVMTEVTRRAVKNGFVVASESEAKRLQEALQRLAW